MENSLVEVGQLDYRIYQMARLLSEHLDLGELMSFSTGSLTERKRSDNPEEGFAARFSRYFKSN